MDIDPMETASTAADERASARDAAASRLSSRVAITVALVATFLGICKVKDDILVQAMQQAQADKLDHWSFYQARNIREEVAKSTIIELQLAAAGAPAAQRSAYASAISKYEAVAADQEKKKNELKAQAEQDQKTYDALNYRDDPFDLSDALIALAISLLAVTALTHKRWLFYVALVPTAFGVLMGLAGLLGWHVHSDTLARLLS